LFRRFAPCESLIAHHFPDVAFRLVRFFFFKENPDFAVWLVLFGSANREDELCDARHFPSLFRRFAPCESLIAHHFPDIAFRLYCEPIYFPHSSETEKIFKACFQQI
ncbi:MAG: hypothetical protein ACI4M1_04295, partial [Christensenellales bacterium]